jgi:hypothetical protein
LIGRPHAALRAQYGVRWELFGIKVGNLEAGEGLLRKSGRLGRLGAVLPVLDTSVDLGICQSCGPNRCRYEFGVGALGYYLPVAE